MKRKQQTVLTLALGSAIAATLSVTPAAASENPFVSQSMGNGYMVAAMEGKCGEGKCGAKAKEGKCGGAKAAEGKCGGAKSTEGKCGGAKATEGKCGGKK